MDKKQVVKREIVTRRTANRHYVRRRSTETATPTMVEPEVAEKTYEVEPKIDEPIQVKPKKRVKKTKETDNNTLNEE